MTTATPPEDPDDGTACIHCGGQVIRNYDGLGTGSSHIWPEDHPLWLASGTRECRPG